MSKKLKYLSEDLVKKAKALGATSAEAMTMETRSLSIEAKNQKLEKIENSDTIDLGIRVFVDSRSACVSISSLDEKALDDMLCKAVTMAKESLPNNLDLPADKKEIATEWNENQYELFDEYVDSQNFNYLQNLTFEMEDTALQTAGISQCESSGFSSNYADFHLTTSNGFSGGYRKTSFQLYCSVIAGTASLMERDYAAETRTFFCDLPDPLSIGKLAASRAIEKLNPRKPPTGSYPVIFEQRISSSLIGHMTNAINGEAISRGSSWLVNGIGKKVLPKQVTLTEDPTRPRISGSRPFDGEGLPTSCKNFIENGVLKQYILDLQSSRKLNLEPSGNAYRSVASGPRPGIGNLKLSQGTNSLPELIRSIGEGLLVTSLIGSTINPNTGDYSRGVSGFWIQNGEVAFPVNECTIAGNLKEMLLTVIPGNDGKEYLSKVIPSLLVQNMTVAGT